MSPPGMPGMPGMMPGMMPGKRVQFKDTVEAEAHRQREMVESTKTRFYVVKEEAKRDKSSRVIGIDLGTTNSCLCYVDRETKEPKIIPSPTGSWVFPTAVTFDKNHEVRLYGEEARACVRTSASATLCSGKRLIGRRFGELGRVQTDMSKTNILTVTESGDVAVEISGRTYTVVHIMAMFLRYLKREAESYLGEPVDAAVVSVPAYFSPQQKVATEDAALCAGFDVLEVIDEPSAACLTYTVLNKYMDATAPGAKRAKAPEKRIERSLVFDLGGGTLDCAILERDTKKNKFTLVATHGDPLLGGNDWDTVISAHFAKEYEEKWKMPIEEEGGNVGQGTSAFRNLSVEAEKAKIHFTHSTEPYYGYVRAFQFSSHLRDIVPLEATMTHELYVALTRPLRVRCLECIEKLLEHSSIDVEDIDNVLLVGAMTRDPPLRHMLMEYFGKAPAPEETCPADYAVAIGAGIRGGMLQGDFPVLSRNTRFVSGTVQSLQSAGSLRRFLTRLRLRMRQNVNPNAIGQRWRGRARGLTDEEIAMYAKELVEFEAACERRLLLERVENDANAIMKRVAADSNKKQGMQERRILQLAEQLKFWQYMVHNFHDHEDELERTTKELQEALDELDGLASDSGLLTETGTIDFKRSLEKIYGDNSAKEARRKEEVPKGFPVSQELNEETPVPKILRRKAPLPVRSDEGQRIVEAGHPVLVNTDVRPTEASRLAFLEAQVEERAWREPPRPPGEQGSWRDVQNAVRAGEVVGAPLTADDLTRPMTMDEMLHTLVTHYPIDDPPTEEHRRRQEEGLDMQTMTVVTNAVDMTEINRLVEEQQAYEFKLKAEADKALMDERREVSAKMFR